MQHSAPDAMGDWIGEFYRYTIIKSSVLNVIKKEEERPDYDKVSKNMIRQCLVDTERQYGDPGGFCYHHFYPYTC